MRQTWTWVLLRWFSSLILAVGGAGGAVAGFGKGEPLIGAMGVVIALLATAWQWDRDQVAEVDRALRRAEVIQHAKDEWRNLATPERP